MSAAALGPGLDELVDDVQTPSPIITPRPHKPRPNYLHWLAAILIIAVSLWTSSARGYLNFDNATIDIKRIQETDVDYHMLYPAIEAKHSFAETFRWWREPWRADQWVGAYWRPLTMQAWWIESRIFGENRPANWMRVSLLLSIVFDLLLLGLVSALTKNKWLAIASLALFTLPPAWFHVFSPLTYLPQVANADLLITQGWKDQPDLWANCLVLCALIFAVREKWWPVLACTALAIAFKESGLMAFPLVAALMFSRGRFKAIPMWVYGVATAMLAAMMYARWLAGPLVFRFHSYGSNHGGLTRFANAMLPLGFSAFYSVGYAVCGIGLFALLVARPKRPMVWLLAAIVMLAIGVASVAIQERLAIDVALAELILIGTVPILLLTAWLIVGAAIWKEKPLLKSAICFAACGYIAALPFAMATQAAVHCLALASAFLAAYGACATFAVFNVMWVFTSRFRNHQSCSVAPETRSPQRPFQY